tara:strand:- start:692 stop:1117 length:426 start_codon:yes stop_codon:yes gene_type:complete
MQVLIVDDNHGDQRLISEYLAETSNKININTASSLEEASRLLTSAHCDIVFLDLHLPDSQGAETIERMQDFIKTNLKRRPVIIVITLSEDYNLGKIAVQNGVKDFIHKDNLSLKTIERAVRFAGYKKELPKRHNKVLQLLS